MPISRLAVLLCLVLASACSDEKPSQQLYQTEDAAAARDQRDVEDARRQRTLGQNEAGHIYNQGALR